MKRKPKPARQARPRLVNWLGECVASGDPLCLASATAGAFFLFSIVYLAISGTFAAEASGTVEELAAAEWRKGVGFMAFTAMLLFAGQ